MNHHGKTLRIPSMVASKRTLLCAIDLSVSFAAAPNAFAQAQETPVKIFGYFQNSFQQWIPFVDRPKQNSFNLQQLNLLFQKDFVANWTAFVKF